MTAIELMQDCRRKFATMHRSQKGPTLGPWTEATGKLQKLSSYRRAVVAHLWKRGNATIIEDWRRLAEWIAANGTSFRAARSRDRSRQTATPAEVVGANGTGG